MKEACINDKACWNGGEFQRSKRSQASRLVGMSVSRSCRATIPRWLEPSNPGPRLRMRREGSESASSCSLQGHASTEDLYTKDPSQGHSRRDVPSIAGLLPQMAATGWSQAPYCAKAPQLSSGCTGRKLDRKWGNWTSNQHSNVWTRAAGPQCQLILFSFWHHQKLF